MLAQREAMATVAVKDLGRAKDFYEKKLGLKRAEEAMDSAVYVCNGSKLLLYESKFAGTNKATAVTWSAGKDVDREARDLAAKGITFEHYDFPDAHMEGDVHVMGDHRAAWFKDPDGNILAIVS
jgi:catechol-2,3-dioxygenase